MKTQLEAKLIALAEERASLIQKMNQMQVDYEACRERVIELHGSIQTTQEMLQMISEVQGDTCSCDCDKENSSDDTESETASGADSNEN